MPKILKIKKKSIYFSQSVDTKLITLTSLSGLCIKSKQKKPTPKNPKQFITIKENKKTNNTINQNH
jgi:hypothetical protein